MVQQATQAQTVDAVLLDGVFVVDAADQALVSDVQQGHAWGFVNATRFGFDDAVFNLVRHAQAMTAANAVGFQNQFYGVGKGFAIQRNWHAFFKAHGHGFGFDFNVVAPESHAHDRLYDFDARIQVFQVFGFVGSAQHVRVG